MQRVRDKSKPMFWNGTCKELEQEQELYYNQNKIIYKLYLELLIFFI